MKKKGSKKELISIIIPTYNESKNIPLLAERIYNVLNGKNKDKKNKNKYKYELIIADDNSPDKTWQIAENLPKKYNIGVLRRMKDKGLSNAVIDGFKFAKGDILGVMDADLQHPPEVLPDLIEPILKDDYEMIVGSRLVEGGGIENWTAFRKFVSTGARSIAVPLTRIKDTMTGLFFLKRSVIENVKIEPKGYKICLEIIVKGDYCKIKEVPFVFTKRVEGESKLTSKVYMQYLQHVFNLYGYKIKKMFSKTTITNLGLK